VKIRTPLLFLFLSLAANAGLVALILTKAPSILSISSHGPSRNNQPAQETTAVSAPSSNATFLSFLAGIDKGDLKAMVATLRAHGASRAVIRALLNARVNDLFYARRTDLADQVQQQPYWNKKFGRVDPKILAAMNALGKQQNDMVNALLGPDDEGNGDPLNAALLRMQEGGISHEAYTRVQSIKADYGEMKNDVYGKMNGQMLPEDMAKIAYLQKEEAADVAKALSPDEYVEYQLRNSDTASYLRNTLQGFNPTEDEFKALFKVQSDFDDQYGSPFTALSPEQQSDRQAHQVDLLANIQQALGPDRYADYKQQTDPAYINTSNLVERLGLPTSVTQDVTSVQSDINKRADAIQKDATLSADQRTTQLAALGDEAIAKIRADLGDNGMTAYRQSAGWWLYRLKPQGK
jgi:hypothetical protein